jgi:hypothetical protein
MTAEQWKAEVEAEYSRPLLEAAKKVCSFMTDNLDDTRIAELEAETGLDLSGDEAPSALPRRRCQLAALHAAIIPAGPLFEDPLPTSQNLPVAGWGTNC